MGTMRRDLRVQGRRALTKFAPRVGEHVRSSGSLRAELRRTKRQVARLRSRLAVVEEEIQENRQLNRRLAELTDVIQELLVPLAQRDEASVRERLERFSTQL